MNLFSDLEGLQGELLATAGLRMLVLRSQECRNEFLNLLNEKSPVGIVASRSHFSCYTEYSTNHDSLGIGRLDMIIELDTVVVGLEIKLSAEFQPQQPSKYEDELQRVAAALATIRRTTIRPYLAVLAPLSRKDEVSAHLSNHHAFISWEEVIGRLKTVKSPDSFITTLVRDFETYLADHLEFLPRFSIWAPHLESQWQPGGTDYQREFLRKLVQLLPGAGVRVGSGDIWVGYYFQPPGAKGRTWIGFMPADRVDGHGSTGARLIIARQGPVRDPGLAKPLEMEKRTWVDGKRVDSWRLKINPSWHAPEDWLKALSPFLSVTEVV